MFEKFEPNEPLIPSQEQKPIPEGEIPMEIIDDQKVRNSAHSLGAHIEGESRDLSDQKISLAGKIVDALKKKGMQIAKISLLLGVLGLSSSKENDDSSEGDDLQKITAKEDLQKPNPEEQQEIIRETGIDIFSIAEEAGFDSEIEIPSKSGKYIIQIGQTHYVEGIESNPEITEKIIGAQKGIEKILIGLAKSGNNEIFAEGTTDEKAQQIISDMGKKERKLAEEVPIGEKCFKDLAEKCKEEIKPFTGKGDSAYDAIALQIQNIFKNRAIELSRELGSKNQFDAEMQKSFQESLDAFRPSGTFSGLGDDAIYLTGSENKLHWEGVINIISAETEEGLVKAKESVRNLNEAQAKTRKKLIESGSSPLDPGNLTHEEIGEMVRSLYELKERQEFFTMENRENIVIEKIRSHIQSPDFKHGLIPLVFGDDHDFKDNIEVGNKNPESELGLIRLSPHIMKTLLKDERK